MSFFASPKKERKNARLILAFLKYYQKFAAAQSRPLLLRKMLYGLLPYSTANFY